MKSLCRVLPLIVIVGGCQTQEATRNPVASEAQRSGAAKGRVLPAIDLGAIAKRAALSFRPDAASYLAQHHAARIEVAGDGAISLKPTRSEGTGRDRKIVSGAVLSLRTAAVGREGGGASSAGHALLDGKGGVRIDRGSIQEELSATDEGLEQAWRVDSRPAGAGNFVVRLAPSGHDWAGGTAHGLHFVDAASGLGFRYGNATWIDADGRRTTVTPSREGNEIVLRVPAALVDSARYPAVLDPLVTPEFGMDNPIGSPANAQVDPAVAFDGTNFLVVWTDSRFAAGPAGTEIFGTRVTPSGTVLDSSGIAITSATGDQTNPVVAWDGASFLVVYESAGVLRGCRVNSNGSLGTDFVVANSAGEPRSNPRIATNSVGTAVVVVERLSSVTSQLEVDALRILQGATTVASSVNVAHYATAAEFAPDVASDGVGFLVVWQDNHLAPSGQLIGQLYTTALTPIGGFISIVASIRQIASPSVGFGGGTYFVAYQNFNAVATWEAMGNLVSTTGTVGPFFVINAGAVANEESISPKAVFNGLDFGVVYRFRVGGGAVADVRVKHYLASGAATGSELTLATGTSISALRTCVGASNVNGTILTVFAKTDLALGGSLRVKGVIEATLPQGASCTAATDCASGFCADGKCCNTACSNSCDVCSLALGATADGVCSNAPIGYVGNPSCGGYVCAAGGACNTVCASDSACSTGNYCNLGTTTCVPKKANATVCAAANECASGLCVDGVCCSSACTQQCAACNLAGSLGVCSAVTGAPVGARPACSGVVPCAGSCNGMSMASCTYPVTSCRTPSCAAGIATAAANCDGTGNCPAPSTVPCGPYQCGASACLSNCAGDGDCIASDFCSGAVCVAKQGNGATCGAPDSCTSNFCSPDAHCCNVACANPPHAVSACTTGTCNPLASCNPGFYDCNALAADGCEVGQGVANCGSCGAAATGVPNNNFICSSNHITAPSCSGGGVCGGACDVGWADCNGSKTITGNGCEQQTTTNGNCGGCGVTCPSTACTTGVCNVVAGNGACGGIDLSGCGTAFCSLVGAGGCGWLDTDGDGLSNRWETNHYIDINCNGSNDAGDVQLAGSNPTVPDVYVVYDWMDLPSTGEACATDADCQAMLPANTHIDETCNFSVCTGHTHDPESLAPGSLAAVTAAFSTRGFNLHIVRGHSRPHSRVASFRHPAAACEGANVAPGIVGGYAVDFYDLKDMAPTSIDGSSKLAFHYGLFAHYSSCDSDAHCGFCPTALNPDGTPKPGSGSPIPFGSTGMAEISGNDFIVSLGQLVNDFGVTPDVFMVGGTFMHELGHNLGLRHGGGTEDGPNYKPNYLSVMNYLYQTSGIQVAAAIGSAVPDHSRLDYSVQTLPTGGNFPGSLHETGMRESAGLGSASADLITFNDGLCNVQPAVASNGPIDWDGNGFINVPDNSSADLNPSDHPGSGCGAIHNQVLNGHTDWGPAMGQSNFTYAFQCLPFYADGVVPAGQYAESELTATAAIQNHTLYPARSVRIDYRPGCGANWYAPGVTGNVSVAIFGAANLDVSKIDLTSLKLAGASALSASIVDLDHDGFADVVAVFAMASMHVLPGATTVRLSGSLQSSQMFVGDDHITFIASPAPIVTLDSVGGGLSALIAPPDRGLKAYTLADCVNSVTDACGQPVAINSAGHILRITSDERSPGAHHCERGDDDDHGDHGDSASNDCVECWPNAHDELHNAQMLLQGPSSFSLRSDRQGGGDGRVYTVYFTVTDSLGYLTQSQCTFGVSRGPGALPVDSGVHACIGTGCSCP